MKTKTVFLGCGALLLIGCLALVLTLFIGGKSFFRYGVGTDLSDYRDAILALETTRSEAATVVSDLEILRQSVSEQNHFGFLSGLKSTIPSAVFSSMENWRILNGRFFETKSIR